LKKIVSIITIITILLYFIIGIVINKNVYALTQTREPLSNKIDDYPGYKELINSLKSKHPNWNFTIFYTGLDWNQVINEEANDSEHKRNLIYYTETGAWVCPTCGDDTRYSGGSWKHASQEAVAYYMDPRNSINESYIFQFEALSFNKDIQNIDGVNQILKDVGYMQSDNITYTKTDGTQEVINKSYAQVIMEAAEEANVSPYHLAARIRQEQGTGDTPKSALATGTYQGYVGYYNFFNIKANGGTEKEVIENGLAYAAQQGLTSPELSIKHGAKFIAEGYIASGQDTLYLQKFDVDANGSMFYHQYMQNVSASKSEGTEVRDSYKKLGLYDENIDFIIPVYENMPNVASPKPGTASAIVTQDVKVKGNSVNIRDGANTSSSVIEMVNTGDVLLKIELATAASDGYIWDKVVLPDGRKGYIARNYIIDIPDITNCNEKVVLNTAANLRNGPGLEGTTIITTLPKGTEGTRVESGKYNLDGYIWDRITLADGTKGYMARNYIDNVDGEEKLKIGNNNLVGIPSLTVQDIKQKNEGKNVQIKDLKGNIIEEGNVGTGYKAIIENKEYTIIKLGDGNGDGKITPADSTLVLRAYVGLDKLSDIASIALNVNKDSQVTPADSTVILRTYVGLTSINL